MLVRGELRRLVTAHGAHDLVGVGRLRPGPERWFARAVLDHGGRIEALLPADDTAAPAALLAAATAVHRLPAGTAGRTLVGTVDALVAVWDGSPGSEPARTVAAARAAGLDVRTVWPDGCESPAPR
ncbi:hypothetical protein [Kitasatospora sp. NBC_01539]|uniref:hypothetical protein n=1 Tax=Kitasatospora sp. NBC_01539 TaxID=2903577 RepID=UPI0038601E8C